jgi:hypothetical protein
MSPSLTPVKKPTQTWSSGFGFFSSASPGDQINYVQTVSGPGVVAGQ